VHRPVRHLRRPVDCAIAANLRPLRWTRHSVSRTLAARRVVQSR
jgi:hypothetical protein